MTQKISIHALVKRATDSVLPLPDAPVISIHALVKRATTHSVEESTLDDNFNPRPREEGDRKKGFRLCSEGYFNPRPREEGDFLLQ